MDSWGWGGIMGLARPTGTVSRTVIAPQTAVGCAQHRRVSADGDNKGDRGAIFGYGSRTTAAKLSAAQPPPGGYPGLRLKAAILLLPGGYQRLQYPLAMRSSTRPAWRVMRPMAVNTTKRNRFGWAVAYSSGSTAFFSNCSRLCVITCSLSQAAFENYGDTLPISANPKLTAADLGNGAHGVPILNVR